MTQSAKKIENLDSTKKNVTETVLQLNSNPALKRLASVINMRNNEEGFVNYSRMHHRHNRS
ncbi:hypothetical protein [Paenibacillus planticolens]|uniref:Uncharacterized protein n=1 Tax=Paenibacillus planticolens TaxID=2654976 RepID=A0ABX1ZHB6_9BACL|nr:hypothetical protein [Paenibacillus planticolens]NOU99484.1 hypothetical protein [Paenibacillus planticolens]